jgi:hypothetical protein
MIKIHIDKEYSNAYSLLEMEGVFVQNFKSCMLCIKIKIS